MAREGDAHHIELISKTLAILEALRDSPDGLTLHDLTQQTGQIKSSIHRVLRSLMRHEYIEQDARGGVYKLGIQFLILANSIRVGTNLLEIARPFSRRLMQTFDETTYIAVLRSGRGMFLDVQETHRDLRLVGPLGAQVHFHATSAGKAIAAFFPAERQDALLRNLAERPITSRTIVDRGHVRREWERVRRLGYAVNDEETIAGAIFLGAPFFDATGSVSGSVSIGIPKPRYSRELGGRIAAGLKQCCGRITESLKAVNYTHNDGFNHTEPRPKGAVSHTRRSDP
jgi:DNA-binding IclR family transcriptional regulator